MVTQQWLDLINTYSVKKRLERGWQYAREGKVLSINFPNQEVIVIVQGTAPKPDRVSLGLDTLSDEDWEYLIENIVPKVDRLVRSHLFNRLRNKIRISDRVIRNPICIS